MMCIASGLSGPGARPPWRDVTGQLDEKLVMNFSEISKQVQAILFAESRDLTHWERPGDDYLSENYQKTIKNILNCWDFDYVLTEL